MRAGILATVFCLFFCAIFAQAAPSPEQKRDASDIIDHLTSLAGDIFTADVEPLLSSITPEAVSLFDEATSIVGNVVASNTALASIATSLLSAAEAQVTGVENLVAHNNGGLRAHGSSSGPLGWGLATALGSVLLGAYVVL
ncbi:hypothetical protein GY45DRAFT_247931 [Cubamyces sp. BRFM 1775]|nr:hypothetical protein GY45DRAFT_247931 [Cubamyces sp. BRFM 1775]